MGVAGRADGIRARQLAQVRRIGEGGLDAFLQIAGHGSINFVMDANVFKHHPVLRHKIKDHPKIVFE